MRGEEDDRIHHRPGGRIDRRNDGVSGQTAATILVLAVTLTIVAVLALVVLPLAVKAAHRANPALSVEEFDLLVAAVDEDSDDD